MEEERRRARARARRGCGSRNTSSSKKTKSADRFFGIFPPDCPACQLPEGNVFRPRPERREPRGCRFSEVRSSACQVSLQKRLSRPRLAPLHAKPVNSARTMRHSVRVSAPTSRPGARADSAQQTHASTLRVLYIITSSPLWRHATLPPANLPRSSVGKPPLCRRPPCTAPICIRMRARR